MADSKKLRFNGLVLGLVGLIDAKGNLYGREVVRHKLKNGIKIHFLCF